MINTHRMNSWASDVGLYTAIKGRDGVYGFNGSIDWDEDNEYLNQVQPVFVRKNKWKMCYCCECSLSARALKAVALKKASWDEELVWFCSIECKTLYRLSYPNM